MQIIIITLEYLMCENKLFEINKKKCNLKKNLMDHWKYNFNYNPIFTNKSSFDIKPPWKSWYAIKQINQIKPLINISHRDQTYYVQ